jgi:vacuolar iron transporter family protein
MQNAIPLQAGTTPAVEITNSSHQNHPQITTPLPHSRIQHLGGHRQYWRDMILGVNDGLVSTFLLVAGVAGGGLTSNNILLTAIAGAIAGAVSMCAGEYIATKSQNEIITGEINLEKVHVDLYLDEELDELEGLMDLIGISQQQVQLRQQMREYYRSDHSALLKIMTALEFGFLDKELRSPMRAGLLSCTLFCAGSAPSVIPFIFSGNSPKLGLVAAAALTVLALVIVGTIKSWASRTSWLTAALENLVVAGLGGGFAYVIGLLFDSVVH